MNVVLDCGQPIKTTPMMDAHPDWTTDLYLQTAP